MEDKRKNKSILDHIKDVDILGGDSMFDEKEEEKETTEKLEDEEVEEQIKKKEEDEYAERGI